MKILQVGFDAGSLGKNEGCREGPREIIKKLKEAHKKVYFDVDEVSCKGHLDEVYQEIYEKCKNSNIMIGGDHSITYSGFKSFKEKYSNPGLLVFDAHPDCEVGTSTVDHESFVRKLIEENILKRENLVMVGLRAFSDNELQFLKEKGIRYFSMDKIFGRIDEVCDTVMEICRGFDGLYVSVDIDVVDPAFAPGTGYLEAGGLSSQEILYFIKRVKLLKNLRFVDLVEVNPSKDNKLTVALGARILQELI